MKYLILFFICVFAVSARGQIALEHTYIGQGSRGLGLVEVDSGVWKFAQSWNDTISIYNMDHSLDRIISIPYTPPTSHPGLQVGVNVIAKRLFDLDTDYCYLADVPDTSGEFGGVKIFKENGTLLFSRDSSYLGTNNSAAENLVGFDSYFPPAIKSTSSGTKMTITVENGGNGGKVEVYSLPGKRPGSSTTLGVDNPTTILASNSSLPTSAYPNPSTGQVRITYELPSGTSNGEMVLTTVDGREVKRYHVTNAFKDLLIEESDLPSGSYFYKLVTDRGESQAKRIVRLK